MADESDRDEFDADDEIGERERGRESGDEEGERMQDTADEGHAADDCAARDGMAAAGEFAVVGERFRKCHADAGAGSRRDADKERDMRCTGCERRRENRRERRHRTIHQTRQPRLNDFQEKRFVDVLGGLVHVNCRAAGNRNRTLPTPWARTTTIRQPAEYRYHGTMIV